MSFYGEDGPTDATETRRKYLQKWDDKLDAYTRITIEMISRRRTVRARVHVRARAVDLDAFLARVSIAETSARTEVAETGTGTPRGRKRRDLARAFDSTR